MIGKNDKKLIIIVASVAVVLVVAIVSTALFFRFRGRDGGEEIAENGGALIGVVDGVPLQDESIEFQIAPTALGQIQIEALSNTEFGIATDSAFRITSDAIALTADHLRSFLSAGGGEEFTIEDTGNGAFVLTFNEKLEKNAIVNLVYQPPGYAAASHAFQTADIFRVTATTPANNTHGVPANTGIEITFSHAIDGGLAAFENAFSIDPPVDGVFLQRDNTYIFAPGGLNFNTTYTVSVRAGLAGVSGEILDEDFMFQFTSQWGTARTPTFFLSGSEYETFLPWDEVFIAMSVARTFAGRDFNVRLYDLQTAENFLAQKNPGVLFEEFALELHSFEAEHQAFHYLFLGRTLPVGWYVAEIRADGLRDDLVVQKFIQISPISVYSISVDTQTVFWVHDAATGQPAHGARVIIDGAAFPVNSEGIAMAGTRQNSRAEILIEYGDYSPFAYVKRTFGSRELRPDERFLSYMYTDRPTYRPNDIVDVFGVIMPRYGQEFRADDRITLSIGNIIEMPVELDSFNSFAVRIPVENMFGHADIIVEVNGERLMSAWINFIDYTNLAFILTGGLDRVAYNLGDYAQVEISLTTFAGRPAEGILLTSHGQPNLRTNADGIATSALPVTTWQGDNVHWSPMWNSFWYNVAGDAQISQHISLPHIVVPRDTMLEYELDGGTITVQTHEILTDRINEVYRDARRWSNIDPDSFRGAPVDIDFQIVITRHVTTRTLRSEQYDHINRRMVRTYNFSTSTHSYRTLNGRTVNGRAVLTGIPVSDDPMISFSAEFRYNDRAGRPTVQWISMPWRRAAHNESNFRHFHLMLESNELGCNETTRVSLVENNDPWWWDDGSAVPLTEGRFLAVLVRDGVISTTVGNPSGVNVALTEAGISNAILFGAFFDGTHIFPVTNHRTLMYDYSERELEIDLSFDAEIYRPGDTVTLTIQAESRSQASPANAQVLISVVDESAIQTGWHEANFLSRLYRSSQFWTWGMNLEVFASHRQHAMDDPFGGGAEGGGGDNGGDNINFRDFFMDNPVFELVQTDANGRATVTFTLPDQITSWRVTAIGLTEDGYAGDTRENIISTLDFYVDLMHTTEYIVGDDIAAVARAFGASGAEVEFIFGVLQNGEVIFADARTTRAGRAVFNAGKLPAGEYVMQIVATSGEFADAVELPFTVAESAMIIHNRATGEFSPDAPFAPDFAMRNMPVRVTLTNANIRPLTRILHSANNRSSFRTDYIAAAAFTEYFFSGETDVYAVRAQVHTDDGGIPELTYGTADLFYTARFAAAFPEFVNARQVVQYVRPYLSSESPAERAAALLALAGIGEPVLLEIRREAGNLIGTAHSDALLYLVAALVAIGDDAGAALLMTQFAPDAATDTEREAVAAALFFINTALDPEAAWAHVSRDVRNRYVSDVPERINFVRRVQFLGGTVSEVQYFLNGMTNTARLENFDRVHLHISREQFDALNLTPVRGDTEYHIDFFGYDSSAWDPAGDRIEISRVIAPANELYRVTLSVTLPPGTYGAFTIYDRLPSNTRFVPRRHFQPGRAFFSVRHTQRQLVELNFFNCPIDPQYTRTLSYNIMELFEADMADGVTYITNRRLDNHIWGSTR